MSVVGSANVDQMVRVGRYPELGETILGEWIGRFPGGKGLNQAMAARNCGARTRFCGQVGADSDGALLRLVLEQAGIDASHLGTSKNQPTGIAQIAVLPGAGNSIIVAGGANSSLSSSAAEPAAEGATVVLVQMEIPAAAAEAALAAGRRSGAVTILNAAPTERITDSILRLADTVVVNETEAAALGGAERILQLGPESVIVTLGSRGAEWTHRSGGSLTVSAFQVPTVDTTGAGDAFCGALAASLSLGDDIRAALQRASAAGAIVATALGAQTDLLTSDAVDYLVGQR